ncbi:hypothetical protein D3C75_536240 [compost metagenome]
MQISRVVNCRGQHRNTDKRQIGRLHAMLDRLPEIRSCLLRILLQPGQSADIIETAPQIRTFKRSGQLAC